MEIYLVRHTETVCPTGICYGQSNVAIKEPYLEIFKNIALQLPKQAVLYTSPLQRCAILADYIKQENNCETVIQNDQLKEMNFGDWELQSWDSIPKEIISPWMENFVTTPTPSGESFQQLHDRVTHFMNTIPRNNSPIIIVTHSGVIRSILCNQQNIPLHDAFKSKLDFGAVIKIIYNSPKS